MDLHLARHPVALAMLDPLLDRQLAAACRSVGDPACGCTEVAIFATLGAHDPDVYWAACDARTAELALDCGVEIWLAQEDAAGAIRIRVEPSAPPAQQAGAPGPGATGEGTPSRRRPALWRWWAHRRTGAAEEVGAAPGRR